MASPLIAPARLPEYGVVIGDKQRKRLEAAGKFPLRVPVTARTWAYVESEILEYVAECIRMRGGAQAA